MTQHTGDETRFQRASEPSELDRYHEHFKGILARGEAMSEAQIAREIGIDATQV